MGKKITQLATITEVADDDLLVGVDISDTSGSDDGTNKKFTKASLLSGLAPLDPQLTGWNPIVSVCLYASPNSVYIEGDWSEILQKGDKFLFTNNSIEKKFYIIGVSAYDSGNDRTTITITAGDVYTVENSAITSIYYSRSERPLGFPQWFTYTPSLTGFSSDPTVIAKFCLVGTTCFINFVCVTNGTSNANTFTISLPIIAKTESNYGWRGWALAVDNGIARNGNTHIASGSSVISLYDEPLSAWTTSGNKSANAQMFYEI